MEVIQSTCHVGVPLSDPSRVGEARRLATQLAHEAALGEVDVARVALVVTELATNLQRHAREGRLLLARRLDRPQVEIIAIDKGPAMPDVARSMRDGYSTAGTAGTGLGAVARMADDFDIHSAVGQGTAVLARVRGSGARDDTQLLCAGAVSVCAPGETACGDGWCVALDGGQASVLVADGLGHGPDAAAAASAALDVFLQDPFARLRPFVQAAHTRLRPTRGAALALMQAQAAGGILYGGAGNVMGRLVSGLVDRTLLTQHGTVGVGIRSVDETEVAWPPHALLVVHSDGIESRWPAETLVPLLRKDPALAAAVLLRDHARGRDDATVAVLRRKD